MEMINFPQNFTSPHFLTLVTKAHPPNNFLPCISGQYYLLGHALSRGFSFGFKVAFTLKILMLLVYFLLSLVTSTHSKDLLPAIWMVGNANVQFSCLQFFADLI